MGRDSGIRKLVSETVIYGMSTILARFINFLFLPLYTYHLTPADYGVQTEFMAYIAIFQVFLTMGMETGCFRYANKEGYTPEKVFSGALLVVGSLSLLFLAAMLCFGGALSECMGYAGLRILYAYIGVILAIDCFTSILFAKLRFEHKAWKFAAFRVLKIFTETGVNLFLFLGFPAYAAAHPDCMLLRFVSPTADFTYPIFAIFASTIVCLLLFLPDIFRFRFRFELKTVRGLLVYSVPLMIAGLPGVMNDFLDRLLFRFFNLDPTMWRADLGIYQAAVKVAVIMSLFVQMFRYAAEPFFFSRSAQKGSKEMYARVMEYFTAFCMLVFLGIVFYMDIIQYIVGRDFRASMGIVPVMLLAYVMLGLLFNVSMWYKLSDRSGWAIVITLAGLAVTSLVNVVFLPRYGYVAAAWGHFFSYMVMLALSAVLGRIYNPFPYRWLKLLGIVAFALLLFAAARLMPDAWSLPLRLALRTGLILVYLGGCYVCEKVLKI
ncbi:MAG: oligosaccharide flippase family protein [Bacteroidales bacterium]|nr:oligosaccharide flippase family protein [Bacteroidales bacterium]